MPITPTYPGVYIEEVASGVRTITGVATAITAFIGRSLRGPVNEPVRIANFGDFERNFGGLWVKSTMSYAVQQYFLNGGTDAIIVRVENSAEPAILTLDCTDGNELVLTALSPGAWGKNLRAIIDHDTKDSAVDQFNLVIREVDSEDPEQVIQEETFLNVSVNTDSPRFVTDVLKQGSALVRVDETAYGGANVFPTEHPVLTVEDSLGNILPLPVGGSDGNEITRQQVVGTDASKADKTGLWSLENADLFNMLCIPPYVREPSEAVDNDMLSTYTTAAKYCKDRRALCLLDPPAGWKSVTDVEGGLSNIDVAKEYSALFFPRILSRDPLKENRIEPFAPSGAVAGIFARTDASRGVWKAPAGIEAGISGAAGLEVKLTDAENGRLNPLGINCLRAFPVIGRVVWGSRTVAGADILASEWKYIPVRRLAMFIEESLYRGTHWVVFEPNDEPLWAQIRLNLGAFMQNLFRQGAFQGSSPADAYFVKCDKETTTQNDINLGVVNIVVGFAPLKPAEFVIIKIQQIAGQVEA